MGLVFFYLRSLLIFHFFVFFIAATNKNMINLLKGYGGKVNPNLRGMLYDEEHEKQKLKSNGATKETKDLTTQKANSAVGAMAYAMSAMKERGERLESLDSTTASLQNEAANYADMAKQLKEKAKKKSIFGL